MNLIRCDHCKTELHEHRRCYLSLERSGLDILTHGDDPGPWHFCSWVCVAQFSNKRYENRES